MKKIINLLFALLLSLSIISCGGGDSGGSSGGGTGVLLPATDGTTDSTPKKPSNSNENEDMRTGTSSSTGCSQATLPAC